MQAWSRTVATARALQPLSACGAGQRTGAAHTAYAHALRVRFAAARACSHALKANRYDVDKRTAGDRPVRSKAGRRALPATAGAAGVRVAWRVPEGTGGAVAVAGVVEVVAAVAGAAAAAAAAAAKVLCLCARGEARPREGDGQKARRPRCHADVAAPHV